jgi:hypothetical protein
MKKTKRDSIPAILAGNTLPSIAELTNQVVSKTTQVPRAMHAMLVLGLSRWMPAVWVEKSLEGRA